MSITRAGLRTIRNAGIRLASHTPFRPIARPERRILLVRPDHFGDLLFLAPATRLLRETVPDHELILLCGPWNAEIAERLLDVDRVVTVPFPGFTRSESSGSLADPYRLLYQTAEQVRDLAPRASVVLRDDHWWGAWMCRAAGIPLRFGYELSQVEDFLTHPLRLSPNKHCVEQNAELVMAAATALGYEIDSRSDLSLFWPQDAKTASAARERLQRSGVRGNFLFVHPGTGAPVKNWTGTGWATVIDALATKTGMDVVLTGSRGESEMVKEIADRAHVAVHDLCGRTSLPELAALFSRSRIVLGVDSGPLHLAVAIGTPTVHLYGPSDPVRYGPWGDPTRHRVIRAGMSCPRCGDLDPQRPVGCGCMMAITPDRVVTVATEVLEDAN